MINGIASFNLSESERPPLPQTQEFRTMVCRRCSSSRICHFQAVPAPLPLPFGGERLGALDSSAPPGVPFPPGLLDRFDVRLEQRAQPVEQIDEALHRLQLRDRAKLLPRYSAIFADHIEHAERWCLGQVQRSMCGLLCERHQL
uniref:Uncharacterized protein n=1 Tax=Anopheles coluzzii TaxID=1518534 RepID=A0A8W7PPT1_ANOCL